ncbi:hypothetical protein AOLI_G00073240 [Acnodon oligacanthus]
MWLSVRFAVRRLGVYVSSVFMLLLLLGQFCALNLLSVLSPALARRIMLRLGERSTMSLNPRFRYEDWAPSFTTPRFLEAVLRGCWSCLGDSAFVGHRAPDCPLITLEGGRTSVHQFIRGNRPLLVRDFGDVADFLVIYIAEAHATDGWAFANNVDINQHRNLQERLTAAKSLIKENPLCPVVVDEMNDITASHYGALPERLYVLQEGKVIYKGGKGPWGYSPEEVRKVLQKMT